MDIIDRLKNAISNEDNDGQLLDDAAEEISKLRNAIAETLDENGHLADGDNCTLIKLKMVMPNVKVRGCEAVPLE